MKVRAEEIETSDDALTWLALKGASLGTLAHCWPLMAALCDEPDVPPPPRQALLDGRAIALLESTLVSFVNENRVEALRMICSNPYAKRKEQCQIVAAVGELLAISYEGLDAKYKEHGGAFNYLRRKVRGIDNDQWRGMDREDEGEKKQRQVKAAVWLRQVGDNDAYGYRGVQDHEGDYLTTFLTALGVYAHKGKNVAAIRQSLQKVSAPAAGDVPPLPRPESGDAPAENGSAESVEASHPSSLTATAVEEEPEPLSTTGGSITDNEERQAAESHPSGMQTLEPADDGGDSAVTQVPEERMKARDDLIRRLLEEDDSIDRGLRRILGKPAPSNDINTERAFRAIRRVASPFRMAVRMIDIVILRIALLGLDIPSDRQIKRRIILMICIASPLLLALIAFVVGFLTWLIPALGELLVARYNEKLGGS